MKRLIAFFIIAVILGAAGILVINSSSQKLNKFVSVGDPVPGDPPKTDPSSRISTFEKALPRATAAFEDAKIAFQTPSRMQIGKSKEVKLILNLKKTIEELRSELSEEFPTQGATIDASPVMEASLSGGAFEIRAGNPERQAVRENENTTWEWSVIPREKGQHMLKLRLYAIVSLQGTSAPMEVKTFEREIPVEVSIPELALKFAKDNIQLVWLVLVVPIAGFLSRFFGGRKKA